MTITDIVLIEGAGPRYRQIADQLAQLIESGALPANSKLPTHRALADQLGVTVGTVTRAYAEAERRGLVEARIGAGTFVVGDNAAVWTFDSCGGGDPEDTHFSYNIPPWLDRAQMLNQAMQQLTRNPAMLNQLMLYQKPEGIEQHRVQMAQWLSHHHVHLDPQRLLFSSGAQNATHMVLDAFCRAGDTLLVEKYSYPGLISLARQKQITLKPVDMDAEGLLPEALDAACRLYQPRLIYAMPTFQNPTTGTLSASRREAILAVCRKHKLYLIEDEVNGLLPRERPEAMVNMDPEQVIHIGALSKCLAPGLRVGYLQVPEKLHTQMAVTLQNHSWMISPLLTGIACELIRAGDADRVLQQIRQEVERRLELTLQYLGEFQLRYQRDCFHVWLKLPEQLRLSEFVAAAEARNIKLKSGELFAPPGAAIPPAVRLSISAPRDLEELEAGLKVVRELLQQESSAGFSL
ncbi:aminotransferase-like domain-containing protein [Marinobacterium jannaschii]|uniref:aminotransferase-like domain-containing protein n=1 Tax=Marinobacterium jannaschii TaxID=64970 RepID=UPI000481D564|nr:PLP-dependent aminotransferase family protein [Marinobacterium jannaschii]